MTKRITLLILGIISFQSLFAQFDTAFVKANIRKCADSLTQAFKVKDWEKFTRYSYPALIGSMGGIEEFKKFTSVMFAQVPDSAWKKYEPGKILQVIKTPGDLQAVIELKSILVWEGYKVTSTSHLIGESWNGGLFWTFFDSEGDITAARVIKPDLSDQIIIPQLKEIKEKTAY